MLTLVKDFLDVLEDITIILWIVSVISSVAIAIVIFFYYFFNGVNFVDKWGSKKLAYFALCTLVEITPLSFLPMSTLSLVIVRYIENHERFKRFTRALAKIEGI